MAPLLASSALPVRVGDIVLGHVVDVILDTRLERTLGLEIRCGDDEHRFLPLAAASLGATEIVTRSPLALLDPPELAFYAERGTSMRALRAGGTLADVELDANGSVVRARELRERGAVTD